MTRLRCAECGLVYGPGAFTRHLTLVAGSTCRRCGGELEEEDQRRKRRDRRPGVVAVRSAVTGRARLPFA